MKRLWLSVCVSLFLGICTPLAAQPLLECAERFVSAEKSSPARSAVMLALVGAYAQHGSFTKVEALLESAGGESVNEFGQSAAVGALAAGYVDQALVLAERYVSAREIAWDKESDLVFGSARERLLMAAPTVEAAERVLAFLQQRGGVSAQALAFVNQQSWALAPLVSEFYFRQLSLLADELRPIDWVGMEESLEASSDEFAPLRERVLHAVVEQRSRLVDELVTLGNFEAAGLEHQMMRYGAILLARRGRLEQADELWRQAGEATPREEIVYLQNQIYGGRAEAMAELIAVRGLKEDALVDLSLFFLRFGQIDRARALDVEPVSYLDFQQARQALGRGVGIDSWLDKIAQGDRAARAEESKLREIATDPRMPPEVREEAWRRLPDELSAQRALNERLATELENLSASPADRVALELLALDDFLRKQRIEISPENLSLLEDFCSRAPRP